MKLYTKIALFAWPMAAIVALTFAEESYESLLVDTSKLWTEWPTTASVIFTSESSSEIVNVTPINGDENYSHAVWTFRLDQMTSSSQIVLYFDGDSSATLVVGSRGIQHLEETR